MGKGWKWVKIAIGAVIGAAISAYSPQAGQFYWRKFFAYVGVSLGLGALNELLAENQGVGAPELEASITASSIPAQFQIGRGRVPGIITKVKRVEADWSDPVDGHTDAAYYILYSVMHNASLGGQRGLHGFWFNGERFELTGTKLFFKDFNPFTKIAISTSTFGPYEFNLIKRDEMENYDDLNNAYKNLIQVYFNFTGDNTNNEAPNNKSATGDILVNNSTPLSWVILRVRVDNEQWVDSSEEGVKGIKGFNPSSVSFDVTGTEPNAADALKTFIMDNMDVKESDINTASFESARNYCEVMERRANGLYRHNEKETVYKELLRVFNGTLVYEFGQIHFKPSRPTAIAFDIDQSMLVEPAEHATKVDLSNYANAATATIKNRTAEYKSTTVGVVRNEVAIAEDGKTVRGDLGSLRFVTYDQQARKLVVETLARASQYSELTLVIWPHKSELIQENVTARTISTTGQPETIITEGGDRLEEETGDDVTTESGSVTITDRVVDTEYTERVKRFTGHYRVFDRGRVSIPDEGIDDVYRIQDRMDSIDGRIVLNMVLDRDSVYVTDEQSLGVHPVDYIPVFGPKPVTGLVFDEILRPSGLYDIIATWTNPSGNDSTNVKAFIDIQGIAGEPLITDLIMRGNSYVWRNMVLNDILDVTLYGGLGGRFTSQGLHGRHVVGGSSLTHPEIRAYPPLIQYSNGFLIIYVRVPENTGEVEVKYSSGAGTVTGAAFELLDTLARQPVSANTHQIIQAPAWTVSSTGVKTFLSGENRIYIRAWTTAGAKGLVQSGLVVIPDEATKEMVDYDTYHEAEEWGGTMTNLTLLPDIPTGILVISSQEEAEDVTYAQWSSTNAGVVFAYRINSSSIKGTYTSPQRRLRNAAQYNQCTFTVDADVQSLTSAHTDCGYRWRVSYNTTEDASFVNSDWQANTVTLLKFQNKTVQDWTLTLEIPTDTNVRSWYVADIYISIRRQEVEDIAAPIPDASTTGLDNAKVGRYFNFTNIDFDGDGTDEAGVGYTWSNGSVKYQTAQVYSGSADEIGKHYERKKVGSQAWGEWMDRTLPPNWKIVSTQITDGAIKTPALGANVVTTQNLAAGSVTATEIQSHAIVSRTIAVGAIDDTDMIEDGTIAANHLKAASVDLGSGTVTGTLKVGNIVSNVFNGRVVWNTANGLAVDGNTPTTFTLARPLTSLFTGTVAAVTADVIEIVGGVSSNGPFGMAAIPYDKLKTGTASSNVSTLKPYAAAIVVGSTDGSTFVFKIWRNSAATELYIREDHGNEAGHVYSIAAIVNPGGTGGGTPVDPVGSSTNPYILTNPLSVTSHSIFSILRGSGTGNTTESATYIRFTVPLTRGGTWTLAMTGAPSTANWNIGGAFSATTSGPGESTTATLTAGNTVTFTVFPVSDSDRSSLTALAISLTAPASTTPPSDTSTDTDSIYIRGTTTPSTPTGGTTTYAHTPSGWSRTNPGPTSTQNVYRSQRTRNFNSSTQNSSTFTSATAWGAPSVHQNKTGSTTLPAVTGLTGMYIRAGFNNQAKSKNVSWGGVSGVVGYQWSSTVTFNSGSNATAAGTNTGVNLPNNTILGTGTFGQTVSSVTFRVRYTKNGQNAPWATTTLTLST